MKKINLEKIYNKFDCLSIIETSTSLVNIKGSIIMAMKEACKQTLELAAENGEVRITENALIEEGSCYICYDDGVITAEVDKQSILDTINQID